MKRVIIAITVCVMTIMINCNMFAFEARDSVSKAPSTSDKKYTTDNLYYKPYHPNDCATYAYGRAWEILGYSPEDVGANCNEGNCLGGHWNAGAWFDWAQQYQARFEAGSEPRVGAIACWSLPETKDGSGHVQVVESITPSRL